MIASLLKNLKLFSGLPEEDIKRLASLAKLKRYPCGAAIIEMGDPTRSLYVIADGRVKIRRIWENGKEVIFSILKRGDIFGEMAFLEEIQRSADVVTITPSDLIELEKRDLEAVMEANKILMSNFIKTLVRRLVAADNIIERLALENVYERLTYFLSEQAEKGPSGRLVIEGGITHTQLAAIIGASREMVSKIMKVLTDGGFLTKKGKDLIINKKLPASW